MSSLLQFLCAMLLLMFFMGGSVWLAYGILRLTGIAKGTENVRLDANVFQVPDFNDCVKHNDSALNSYPILKSQNASASNSQMVPVAFIARENVTFPNDENVGFLNTTIESHNHPNETSVRSKMYEESSENFTSLQTLNEMHALPSPYRDKVDNVPVAFLRKAIDGKDLQKPCSNSSLTNLHDKTITVEVKVGNAGEYFHLILDNTIDLVSVTRAKLNSTFAWLTTPDGSVPWRSKSGTSEAKNWEYAPLKLKGNRIWDAISIGQISPVRYPLLDTHRESGKERKGYFGLKYMDNGQGSSQSSYLARFFEQNPKCGKIVTFIPKRSYWQAKGGHLLIGATGSNEMDKEFGKVEFSMRSARDESLELTEFKVGDVVIPLGENQRVRLSIGTPNIRGYFEGIKAVAVAFKAWRHDQIYFTDCIYRSAMPNITISIQGATFVLTADDYLTNNSEYGSCTLPLEGLSQKHDDWILGLPFIMKYPFSVDYTKKKLTIFKNKQ